MSQETEVIVEHDHVSATGQIVKFGLLAAVLVGAVLVVMLTRPLIFDRILPAVMGMSETVEEAPPPDEGPAPAENGDEAGPAATPEAPAVEASPGVTTTETISPTTTTGDGAVEPETEVEAPALEIHVVQPGEYLAVIAQRYGVTVEDLIRENNLTDPNRLFVGTQLRIPAPEE